MKKRHTKSNKSDNSGFNLLVLKALEFFIQNPYQEIYLREFARRLRISPNTAQRFLDLFLKENLILEEKKANLRFFKANLDNLVFKQIKKTYSVKKIIDSGLINELKNKTSHVVLFGSMAEGLDSENSDMDFLIISSDKNKIRKIISDFQNKINREINEHIFSWSEWKKQAKMNRGFYQDIISKGINLIGDAPIAD